MYVMFMGKSNKLDYFQISKSSNSSQLNVRTMANKLKLPRIQ